ncbi:Ribonuclease H domain [Sesbania bispinosa]|nr:Ribonuclease H domain [Sesbania bispinosa]
MSANNSREWSLLFGLAIWVIWKSRNACVFEAEEFSSDKIFKQIHYHVDPVIQQQGVGTLLGRPRYREELVRWSFPIPGWIKVNVDGSLRQGSNRAGCGGVFRGADGKWILGFSMNLGRGSVLFAELKAVELALRIAWDNGFTHICVESDSLLAISLIEKGSSPHHPFASILKHIHCWKQKNWQVTFAHSFREGNRVADWFANSAPSRQFGLHLISSPPAYCIDLLWQDSIGVALSGRILS